MSLGAVLFDLDGTLVDTAPDFINVLQKMCHDRGIPCKSDALIRAQVSQGATAMTCLGFDTTADDAHFQSLLDTFLDHYGDIAGAHSELFEPAHGALQWLQERAIPWGVVTNKPRRFTEPLLARLGLEKNCACVVCPEDVNRRKPDPESLLLACKQLQVTPGACIYLGDHRRDIEAALAANISAVACRWGYLSSATEADTWNADHVVGNTNELLNLLTLKYV